MCVIWGSTFSLIRESLAGTDPLVYLCLRFAVAAPVALLVFRRRIDLRDTSALWRGALLGAVLFLGFLFQTLGLSHTTATRSGFLTALYIVFVPVLLAFLRRRAPRPRVLLATLCALGGLVLMSGPGLWDLAALSGSAIRTNAGVGEVQTVVCALFFALQILMAGRFPSAARTWSIHFWQLLTVLLLSALALPVLGEPRIRWDGQLALSLFVTGILGTVLALGLQLRFQRETTPERAAVIYSFEPVFAALAAFLLLGERIGGPELLGGVLILAGLQLADRGAGELDDPPPLRET